MNTASLLDELPSGVMIFDASCVDTNEMLDLIDRHESHFTESMVASYDRFRIKRATDKAIRDTLVLPSHYSVKCQEEVSQFLKSQREQIAAHIGLRAAQWNGFSASILSYGNGCYFKKHKDTGHSFSETRVLTFVLMLHREPRRFSGGELILYANDGSILTRIEPKNGRIILFDPELYHEVTPIKLSEKNFMDRRFTFVGWAVVRNSTRKQVITHAKAFGLSMRNVPVMGALYRLYKRFLRPHL